MLSLSTKLNPRALGLVAIPDLRVLHVDLVAKLCHESVITKKK